MFISSEASRVAFSPTTVAAPGASSSKADATSNTGITSKTDDGVFTFLKEVKKSPIERMRDSILKRHDMTEEQFNALSDQDKSAIMQEITDALKQTAKDGGTAAKGQMANMLV